MDFPREFPPESRAAVEAERLRAGIDFDKARQSLRLVIHGGSGELEAELRKYILRPFAVFAREACKLATKREWHAERIEPAVREFLRLLTIEARAAAHDRSGSEFAQHWIDSDGLTRDVRRQFEQSQEWLNFMAALIEVADHQSQPPPQSSRQSKEQLATEAPPQASPKKPQSIFDDLEVHKRIASDIARIQARVLEADAEGTKH